MSGPANKLPSNSSHTNTKQKNKNISNPSNYVFTDDEILNSDFQFVQTMSLYIFTLDIPQTQNTFLAAYTDDTSILSSNKDTIKPCNALQLHLDHIEKRSTNWKIKINATKSVHVPLILNKKKLPILSLQGVTILSLTQVKYLGIILDIILIWGPHLKSKIKSLNTKFTYYILY